MHASLLDRLIDHDPGTSREPVQYRQITYSQMKRSVARDLENLLNTKCFTPEVPEGYKELPESLYVYGLPDFTSKNPGSPSVRTELRQGIEKVIATFEPRLHNVMVQIEESNGTSRELRFKIHALLVMEQDAEPVSFDTLFDVNSGHYQVPN